MQDACRTKKKLRPPKTNSYCPSIPSA
eukprot:SAG11_NODE_8117_length_1058_cov_2.300313_1_plen_26_part_10